MLKKHWFNLLVYSSLAFLFYKLFRNGQMTLPGEIHLFSAVVSVLFLLVSFFLLSMRWKYVLRSMRLDASIKECIISVGIPIFSKYIPGKVFMIIGKTGYLNKKKGFSIAVMSVAALTDQILAIVTGLALGSVVILETGSVISGVIPVTLLWTALVVFLFHPGAFLLIKKAAEKMLHRPIDIQMPAAHHILKLLPWHFAYWLSISVGFYFLTASTNTGIPVSPIFSFTFPLAVCAGMIVLIAPGGIGVRESVIAGACEALGLNGDLAASIAVTSRLWFVLGELIVFLTALILKKNKSS